MTEEGTGEGYRDNRVHVWVWGQHKRKMLIWKLSMWGTEARLSLSYFNNPETPIISCYLPQNNHMVFQDRKVAIRSPKTLEFALVKPKRAANESQLGFRALCYPVTARKLWKTGWSETFARLTALLVTSCKSTEMSASVSENLLPGFHFALLPLHHSARRNREHPQLVFFSLNSSRWPKLRKTFAPRSEPTQTHADLIPPLKDLGGLLQLQKLHHIWQDLRWSFSVFMANF